MGLPPGFQQDGEETMRPAILIGSDNKLTSALVSDADQAELKLGMKVVVTEPIDLAPHGVCRCGEQGVVAHIDPVNGLVEIKLELLHWGLSEWHNCMWLLPFGTEDILHKIACVVGTNALWNYCLTC
jgi:hypothetical protein